MKKIYLVLIFFVAVVFGYSQNKNIQRQSGKILNPIVNQDISVHKLAVGDTLLYFPFLGYSVDSTDAAKFSIQNKDRDSADAKSNPIWVKNWGYFYSENSWDKMPWNVDTGNYYIAATSWFTDTTVRASNWFVFGPIKIPGDGANIRWFAKTNPAYRDGYEILLSTTGMNIDSDFTNPPIYQRSDCFPCDASNATDTIFQPFTVNIPASFDTQQVYFAFHHNALNMDVLYIDEILITEGLMGVEEKFVNDIKLNQNIPNPFNKTSVINYEIIKPSKISLEIYDIMGRKLMTINESIQHAGKHSIAIDGNNFAKGIYFYTLKANETSLTKRMVITE